MTVESQLIEPALLNTNVNRCGIVSGNNLKTVAEGSMLLEPTGKP